MPKAYPHVFTDRSHRLLLGKKLEFARLKQGLSQMDALLKTGLLVPTTGNRYRGVTKGFLAYVEHGTRGVTPAQTEILADFYGISLRWLLSGKPLTAREEHQLDRLRTHARAKASRTVSVIVPQAAAAPNIRIRSQAPEDPTARLLAVLVDKLEAQRILLGEISARLARLEAEARKTPAR